MTQLTTRDGRPFAIRHAVPDDAAALIRAVDTVMREGRWGTRLTFDMPEGAEREFLASLHPARGVMLVATVNEELVGWVDLNRSRGELCAHTAALGIGVLEPHRGVCIGTALVQAALDWAKGTGLEKICLSVRADNPRARYVYARAGFIEEGRRLRQVKTPAGYVDDILMARFV